MDPSPTPTPPSDNAPNDLLDATVQSQIKACDIVFGTTSIVLALLGTWFFFAGQIHGLTLLALWGFPIFNVAWSALTRRRDRVRSDILRGALSLPIAAYLYVAEPGMFEKLWIPAVIMTVGMSLATGIASRRGLLGNISALTYAGVLLGVTAVHFGSIDAGTINDTFGIALTGFVVSLVASKLGRTLDEARHQRDVAREQKDRAEAVLIQLTQRSRELTVAIENLHDEMARRMRVEVELRQAQKLESVGRLASGVAHEINTPVQFVSDSIQFVRDGVVELLGVVGKLEPDATDTVDLPYLAENVPKALDRALDGLSRVSTIVRSMKEFAHPDAKEKTGADLNRAIASTLTMAHNEYKHVAELDTDYGALPPIQCYVGELNQAVLNIVVNAAHAIGDVVDGTASKGRIGVRTYRDGNDVVIAISDTGGGIPEPIRDHIFDPFFTTKPVGRGTGQGLAIAHSVVVDKHHGRLSFDTELGKGTTFYIRLAIDGPAQVSRSTAA